MNAYPSAVLLALLLAVAPHARAAEGDDEPKPATDPAPSPDAEEAAETRPAAPAPRRDHAAGAVRVHIETKHPGVELREEQPGAESFVVVCRQPCDRVVDGRDGRSFFFAGEGITPSPTFALDRRRGDVTAAVKPGSAGLRTGGAVVSGVWGRASRRRHRDVGRRRRDADADARRLQRVHLRLSG